MYTILKNIHVYVYKILAQKNFREKIIHVYVCKKLSSEKKIFLKKKFKFFSEPGSKTWFVQKIQKTSEKIFFSMTSENG